MSKKEMTRYYHASDCALRRKGGIKCTCGYIPANKVKTHIQRDQGFLWIGFGALINAGVLICFLACIKINIMAMPGIIISVSWLSLLGVIGILYGIWLIFQKD